MATQPTEQELTNALKNQEQFVNPKSNVLTSADLSSPSTNLSVPPQPQGTDYTSVVDANINALTGNLADITAKETTAENEKTDLNSQMIATMELLNTEKSRIQEEEAKVGLDQQRKDLQENINTLKMLQNEMSAIPIEIQNEFAGRGATRAGVEPIQNARLRTNAIQALRISAIAQGQQGNIQLAQDTIAKAIEAEFEPQRQKLDILKQLYDFNRDDLERIDKKKADALNFSIQERARLLAKEESNKDAIYNVGMLARKYGADTATVEKIFSATNREDAVAFAGQYLQDPMAKQQLANAVLDNELTKLKINREAYEFDLFKKYGGMTPKEYADSLKKETEETAKITDETKKSQAIADGLSAKMTLLKGLYDPKTGKVASGLDTVVGSTFFARGGQRNDVNIAGRFLKGVGTALSLGTGGALYDEATGSADNVVNVTEQFISQEFLDQLIQVKAKGATFGALQKSEQDALTSASTKIGGARIYSGTGESRKVIGYDMSEADFKAEIEKIIKATESVYKNAIGDTYTPEEKEILDAYEDVANMLSNSAGLPNPQGYFSSN